MTLISRFVSLATASVPTPASTTGSLPAMSHLAAIGMFVAERHADGAWRFALRSHANGAGDAEDRLLAWATDALPDTGTVLGWQLAEAIVPPLLEAGAAGDPAVAHAFLERFLRLVTAPSVDLAVPHGGAGAPPLAEVAGRHGIAVAPLDAADIESGWAFGNRRLLAAHVEAQAIATWRLWLAEGGDTGRAAAAAFANWACA